jgi:hypothetical protein
MASFGFSCPLLFIFDLLCKRVFSLPCIGSAVCSFIYKAGQKHVSKIQPGMKECNSMPKARSEIKHEH